MVFHVALFTSFFGLASKSFLRCRCVAPAGTVTHLALDIFQSRSIQLADKASRKVKADHMTNKTFRIKCLVNFS